MGEEARRVGPARWTEQEARAALDELAHSGMSVAKFVRSKGVSMQRIAYWRKRLSQPVRTEFVAVSLAKPTASRMGASLVEIEVGGVIVRVRGDLDAEHLGRIVGALRQHVRC
jgi:hypothetical protein